MQIGAGQPRIVLKAGFTVVGLSACGGNFNGEVEALWDRLGERFAEIPNADPDCGYGLHTWRDGVHCYLAGLGVNGGGEVIVPEGMRAVKTSTCLLYTSDAADEEDSVDLGGRRIIKKKKYE